METQETERKTIEKKQLTETDLLQGDVRLVTPIIANRASQPRYGGSALKESEEDQMGRVNYESSLGTGGDQLQSVQGLIANTNIQNDRVGEETRANNTSQRVAEKKCEDSPSFVRLGRELEALAQEELIEEEKEQLDAFVQLSESSSSSDCYPERNPQSKQQRTKPKSRTQAQQASALSQKIATTMAKDGGSPRMPMVEVEEEGKDEACPGPERGEQGVQSGVEAPDLAELKKVVMVVDDAPAQPLFRSGISMAADMKLGWKPKSQYSGAPIPLFYDFEEFKVSLDGLGPRARVPIYLGPRIHNSLLVHRAFARKIIDEETSAAYKFKFPPKPPQSKQKRVEGPRDFTGMNPDLELLSSGVGTSEQHLTFDSAFESGNLDMAYRATEEEYYLYMRVDTNTRGHHQWFYFSVEYQPHFQGRTVTFNIMNFTKDESLYTSGMRVCVRRESAREPFQRGGFDISYKQSRHVRKASPEPGRQSYFYQLKFSYTFEAPTDKVYFAYCFPYTFSMLQSFIKEVSLMRASVRSSQAVDQLPLGKKNDYFSESVLSKSLSGADVPLLTITSRLTSDPGEYNLIKMEEFEDQDSKVSMPMYKRKKYVVVTGRVHPGESNSSWVMQGFIKCLMGSSLQAKQLRKRLIFLVVPMINVDGVIIGNYRTSMAGNDLNRRYLEPEPRLHPEVCAVKELVHELIYGKDPAAPKQDPGKQQPPTPTICDEDIMAFVDLHGHSRKKNVFVYGPQFPLSSDKYYRCRLIPKLLSEETSKFRYHSSSFKYEYCKRKTARVVLAREYNIMNCYTLEASFSGHFDENRRNYEFNQQQYEEMGEHFLNSLYEYTLILEEEQRLKQLREMEKKKRKKAMEKSMIKPKETPQAGSTNNEQSNKDAWKGISGAAEQEHSNNPQNQSKKDESVSKKNRTEAIHGPNRDVIQVKKKKKGQASQLQGADPKGKDNAAESKGEQDCEEEDAQLASHRSLRDQKLQKKYKNKHKNKEEGTDAPKQKRQNSKMQKQCQENEDQEEEEIEQQFEQDEVNDLPQATAMEGNPASSSQEKDIPKVSGGIRNIKAIFHMLQEEEDIHEEMLKIEEEELGFVPDKDEQRLEDFEPDFDISDAGEDSDASDGELGGKDKKDLFSDIIGAINQFSQQYDGKTSYNEQAGRYRQQRKKNKQLTKKRRAEASNSGAQPAAAASRFMEIKQGDKPAKAQGKSTAKKSVPPVKLDKIKLTKASGYLHRAKDSNQMGELVTPKNIQIPDMGNSLGMILSTPYQARPQEEVKVSFRSKLAQQGLLNRIGMRIQAANTIPMQTYQAMRITNAAQLAQQAALEAQAQNQGAVLSPLVVNKIYTNQTAKNNVPFKRNTNVNPHERRVSTNLRHGSYHPGYTQQPPDSTRKKNKFTNQQEPGLNHNDFINEENFLSHGQDLYTGSAEQNSQMMQSYFMQKYGQPSNEHQRPNIEQVLNEDRTEPTPVVQRNHATGSSVLDSQKVQMAPFKPHLQPPNGSLTLQARNDLNNTTLEAFQEGLEHHPQKAFRRKKGSIEPQAPSPTKSNAKTNRHALGRGSQSYNQGDSKGDNQRVDQNQSLLPPNYHQNLQAYPHQSHLQQSYQGVEFPAPLSGLLSREGSKQGACERSPYQADSTLILSESPEVRVRPPGASFPGGSGLNPQLLIRDYAGGQVLDNSQHDMNSHNPHSLFSRYRQQEQSDMLKAHAGTGNIFRDKQPDPEAYSMLSSLNIISLAATKKYDHYQDYGHQIHATPKPKTSKSTLDFQGMESMTDKRTKQHLRHFQKVNPSLQVANDPRAQKQVDVDHLGIMSQTRHNVLISPDPVSQNHNRKNLRRFMDKSYDAGTLRIRDIAKSLSPEPPKAALNPIFHEQNHQQYGASMLQPILISSGVAPVLSSNFGISNQKTYQSNPVSRPNLLPVGYDQFEQGLTIPGVHSNTVQQRSNKYTGTEQLNLPPRNQMNLFPSLAHGKVAQTPIFQQPGPQTRPDNDLRSSQSHIPPSLPAQSIKSPPKTINMTTRGPFAPAPSSSLKIAAQRQDFESKGYQYKN